MTELRRPEKCPECGGTRFVRIIRGRPSAGGWAMIDRGEAIMGGCFVSLGMPDWHCQTCSHEWLDLEDPARQEIEEILKRVRLRRQDSVKE